MRSRVAVMAVGGMVLAALPVPAQGSTASVRVNLPVTNAISVLDVSVPSTDIGTIGSAQFTAGVAQATGPTVRVRSNRSFAVTIASGAATFGPSSKPSSAVSWSLSSGGSYTALSTSPATMIASSSGGAFTQALFFRMAVSLATDVPGSYQLGLSLTLTAP